MPRTYLWRRNIPILNLHPIRTRIHRSKPSFWSRCINCFASSENIPKFSYFGRAIKSDLPRNPCAIRNFEQKRIGFWNVDEFYPHRNNLSHNEFFWKFRHSVLLLFNEFSCSFSLNTTRGYCFFCLLNRTFNYNNQKNHDKLWRIHLS